MRTNMREFERTLQVDVRVPIKAQEPLGSVSLSLFSRYRVQVHAFRIQCCLGRPSRFHR